VSRGVASFHVALGVARKASLDLLKRDLLARTIAEISANQVLDAADIDRGRSECDQERRRTRVRSHGEATSVCGGQNGPRRRSLGATISRSDVYPCAGADTFHDFSASAKADLTVFINNTLKREEVRRIPQSWL
jgi:hypothetical protein